MVDFEAKKASLKCRGGCGHVGMVLVEAKQPSPHKYKAECPKCRAYFDWIRSPENDNRTHRTLSPEIRDQVWAEYQNRCAHCNLTVEQMRIFGAHKTVQHAPAYKDVGENGNLIPYCSHCQEGATMVMRQREAVVRLVERTTKKMDENNGAA